MQAALDRCLKLVEATSVGDHGYGDTDGIEVHAFGSHSVGQHGLLSASFSVSVKAIKL